MNSKVSLGLAAVAVILVLGGLVSALANPASVYCEQHYGSLERYETAGGESNYCVLPDGTKCDEWSYYRGECAYDDRAILDQKMKAGDTMRFPIGALKVKSLTPLVGCTEKCHSVEFEAIGIDGSVYETFSVREGEFRQVLALGDVEVLMVEGAAGGGEATVRGTMYFDGMPFYRVVKEKTFITVKNYGLYLKSVAKGGSSADIVVVRKLANPFTLINSEPIETKTVKKGESFKSDLLYAEVTFVNGEEKGADSRAFLWITFRPESESEASPLAVENPAKKRCEENGGSYEYDATGIEKCVLPDGTECDAWAYYHKVCPVTSAVQDGKVKALVVNEPLYTGIHSPIVTHVQPPIQAASPESPHVMGPLSDLKVNIPAIESAKLVNRPTSALPISNECRTHCLSESIVPCVPWSVPSEDCRIICGQPIVDSGTQAPAPCAACLQGPLADEMPEVNWAWTDLCHPTELCYASCEDAGIPPLKTVYSEINSAIESAPAVLKLYNPISSKEVYSAVYSPVYSDATVLPAIALPNEVIPPKTVIDPTKKVILPQIHTGLYSPVSFPLVMGPLRDKLVVYPKGACSENGICREICLPDQMDDEGNCLILESALSDGRVYRAVVSEPVIYDGFSLLLVNSPQKPVVTYPGLIFSEITNKVPEAKLKSFKLRSGPDAPVYDLELTVPGKLFLLFNYDVRQIANINAHDGRVLKVYSPDWLSWFSSYPRVVESG